MKLEYSGKRVLILGGSCDIAIELGRLLIEEGLYPILSYRNNSGKDNISKGLGPGSGKFETCKLDLKDNDTLSPFYLQLNSDVDYLVDFIQGDFESLVASADSENIIRYFDENINTRAVLLKEITRMMVRKKSGRLIFISSAAAGRPNPGQGYYAASKLAAEALYRNIGIELAGRGITTLTLRPGYIKSGRGKRFIENKKNILDEIPTKKALSKKEVAEAILFFLSDNALGFNATEITMDGGLTSGK